jgi:allophanate hydrolase
VFLRDGVKAPLALGDVLLADGSLVKGFVGESYGVVGAPDISSHSGWRSFLASSSA